MVKLIEIACTANQGRSPVAELIARNRLEEVGALGEYDSISSGTLVKVIQKGAVSIETMTPIIKTAKTRGDVYTAEQLSKLDRALRNGDTETVKHYFIPVAELFEEEELESRKVVLGELGIKGEVKSTQDQTILRPNVVTLLAMDDQNYKRAQYIYANSEYNPRIENLGVKGAFGLGEAVYRDRINQLLEKVPKEVDKTVGA